MDEFSVLLVDDEREFLETLLIRLLKRRIKVTGVNSGKEALKILKETPPDVVVLDVRMQGVDGLQTLREIKKIRPLVEVIMLTGHANLEVAAEGMEAGAFDYLMKPIDVDELLYKLEDAFKRKKIQEQKIRRLEEEKGSERG
ncbi:MAG: response regulator [Proteobacteria bacterium]|nr:response regulator [Pseudomonadota bacterium]MBU2621453.1 response regulator [Pseudomonadota bacterium]